MPTRRRRAQCVAALVLLTLLSPESRAQQDTATFMCHGELVSRVDIHPSPPPFSGAAMKWRIAAHAVGLHHSTTTPGVIAAFLSLVEGGSCTEKRRAESERVLRAQPFLSDATVRVMPDSNGEVIAVVTTTDEVPVLVNGRFRGVALESFSLGNANIAGEALRVVARIERGGAYRTSVGALIEEDAIFGHAYRLTLEGDRYQVGQRVGVALQHPFFTDLQRVSWHTGITTRDSYERFDRPARDPLALQALDQSWDGSVTMRLFGTQTVALLGGAVTGRRFDPAAAGIVVHDSGFGPDTGVTLAGRYQSFRADRVGITGGLRQVSFRTVHGFDALVGPQDVASGALLGLFVARGIPRYGEEDLFLSSAMYAGVSRDNMLLASLAQVEARRDPSTHEWDSVIGSSRTALYWGRAPGVVLVVADELSGGARSRLPLQLTFGDRDGGLIAYRNSGLAGAQRNIARGELRWSAESMVRHADVGLAAFGEMGTLWAGDAPYGMNATRASVGVSLLAAYPTRAKRMYRADLAIPLTRSGVGGGKIEVRFSSFDRTQGFWVEPGDVARSRTGSDPRQLFAWPSR